MSLDWNYRRVGQAGQDMIAAAWVGEKGQERNPALDSVIWATMAIGIGDWTAANMPEVQRRMAIYQYLTGPAISYGDGRAYYVTPDELAKLEGFSTNVTKETPAAFAKKAMRWLQEEAEQKLRQGCKQFLGEGGPDLEACGAFQALANSEAKRKAEAAAASNA